MTWVVVDVESDGPCPHLYSMVSFGAVIVEPGLARSFYGLCRPISDQWIPEALAVSGHTREECMGFPPPEETMERFMDWIMTECKARRTRDGGIRPDAQFVSDNNGFDWQFINYYFHRFCRVNPFGFSSTRINDLWKGMERSMFKSFKHLRKTAYTHNPVDDARGNAEALLAMKKLGLQANW